MTASTALSNSGMRSGRHQPSEDERVADAAPLEVGDQPIAEDAVADPDEADLGVGREHVGGDGDDVVVPFELKQSRDRGKGDLVVREPQLAPHVGARTRRIEKRLGIHTTINREKLLRPADAGGECLLGHRVAYADDRVTSPGRPPLERDVEAVFERRFEFSKGHSVDRVHDRRHFLVPRGRPAEDPCLGAMSVHNLGLDLTKGRPQPPVGLQVDNGPDRPDELGKYHNLEAKLRGAIEQIPLRPFRRSGDQGDIVVIVMVQALDRQKRVLLGAADDQPGDDVNDPHFRLDLVDLEATRRGPMPPDKVLLTNLRDYAHIEPVQEKGPLPALSGLPPRDFQPRAPRRPTLRCVYRRLPAQACPRWTGPYCTESRRPQPRSSRQTLPARRSGRRSYGRCLCDWAIRSRSCGSRADQAEAGPARAIAVSSRARRTCQLYRSWNTSANAPLSIT